MVHSENKLLLFGHCGYLFIHESVFLATFELQYVVSLHASILGSSIA